MSFGAQAKEQSKQPLNIYVPGSYTGIMPFLADGIYDATMAFATETNMNGGILGRKLVVIKQDDQANLVKAETNAMKAINDPNHLLTIGHSFSSIALPIAKIYNKHQKLFFTPYATNSKLSELKGTFFQLCFNDRFQGETLAKVATEKMKARRILVLRNRSDVYADGLSATFLKFVGKNHKDVETKEYSYIENSFKVSEVEKILKSFSPDIIFLPELKVKAANIVKSLNDQAVGQARFLGGDGWGSEDGTVDIFFNGTKNNNRNYYYTYHWHKDIPTIESKHIKAKIKKLTGKNAYGPGVISYESLWHLESIIRKIQIIDQVKIAKELRGSSYKGSTGIVTFREDGSTSRDLVLLKLNRTKGLTLDSLVNPRKKSK